MWLFKVQIKISTTCVTVWAQRTEPVLNHHISFHSCNKRNKTCSTCSLKYLSLSSHWVPLLSLENDSFFILPPWTSTQNLRQHLQSRICCSVCNLPVTCLQGFLYLVLPVRLLEQKRDNKLNLFPVSMTGLCFQIGKGGGYVRVRVRCSEIIVTQEGSISFHVIKQTT